MHPVIGAGSQAPITDTRVCVRGVQGHHGDVPWWPSRRWVGVAISAAVLSSCGSARVATISVEGIVRGTSAGSTARVAWSETASSGNIAGTGNLDFRNKSYRLDAALKQLPGAALWASFPGGRRRQPRVPQELRHCRLVQGGAEHLGEPEEKRSASIRPLYCNHFDHPRRCNASEPTPSEGPRRRTTGSSMAAHGTRCGSMPTITYDVPPPIRVSR